MKKTAKNNKTNMKKIGITPLGDRVLVRPEREHEDMKVGGIKIVLPENMNKEKSDQGRVLAVGEGKMVDGKLQTVRVKVGDTVIFSKYGYDEVKVDGEELYLLKEDSILAVVNK